MPASRSSLSRYDVIAVGTSAGGLEALQAVLDALPEDVPAAVLVLQHLGRYGSALVEVLAGRIGLPVSWVTDGLVLTPGQVFVCPPQRAVAVRRDPSSAQLTCAVLDGVQRAMHRPIDTLFSTLAEAVGPRAIGVVLTGMGQDGAAGAQALDRVGAVVLAQSEASARYPAMPRAAAATGAVDLVLPLDEIGPLLAHIVGGGQLPRSRAETDAGAALFAGSGAAQVGPVLAGIDWATTPLGPVLGWSVALETAVRIALASHVPMSVYWGAELVQIYNDASLGLRGRLVGLGRPAHETRSVEGRAAVVTCEQVARTRTAVLTEDQEYVVSQSALAAEVYATSSWSAILDPSVALGVGGVLDVGTETTVAVLGARRALTLRRLVATRAERRGGAGEAAARAVALLGANPRDVPFALVYLLDATGQRALLAACAGLVVGGAAAPAVLRLAGEPVPWPLASVVRGGVPFVLDHVGGAMHATSALLVPLPAAAGASGGVLILGMSPKHASDPSYRDFLDLASTQVNASIGDAWARATASRPRS